MDIVRFLGVRRRNRREEISDFSFCLLIIYWPEKTKREPNMHSDRMSFFRTFLSFERFNNLKRL